MYTSCTWVGMFYITIASMWLHACQYIALISCVYMSDTYGRVRMHVAQIVDFLRLFACKFS